MNPSEGRRILFLSMLIGLSIVAIDIVFDSVMFLHPTSLLGALYYEVPPSELVGRLFLMTSYFGFAHLAMHWRREIRRGEERLEQEFRRGVVYASKSTRNKAINIGNALWVLRESGEYDEKYIEIAETNARSIFDLSEGEFDTEED
ncbi:hypothetical protein JXL21_02005 [Candidatus Bathyarchaeota archaeon]|nr:hypothetical protein [Candidatus Bathyarchaeota archaeon]